MEGGDNPFSGGSDGDNDSPRSGGVGGGGGDSFVSDADADPLGAIGGGLINSSYGGSDNPFAGAHDGDEFDAAPLSSSTLVTQLEQTLPGGWGNESGVMPGGAAANNSITHHTADEDLTNSLQDVNISDDPLSAPAPAAQPAAAAAASPAPAQDLGPLSPSAPSLARGAVAAAPPMGGSMGMSYGDLLAPPPSYADSVMYSKPPGEIQSQEEYVTGGGGGGGGGNGFGGGGDAGGHQTITLSQALSGGGGGGGAGLQQGQSSSSSPGGGISGGGVSAGSMEGTLEVTVTDPQKSPETSSSLGAMGRKIVTYKVHARSNLPQYAVGQYKSNPADP